MKGLESSVYFGRAKGKRTLLGWCDHESCEGN